MKTKFIKAKKLGEKLTFLAFHESWKLESAPLWGIGRAVMPDRSVLLWHSAPSIHTRRPLVCICNFLMELYYLNGFDGDKLKSRSFMQKGSIWKLLKQVYVTSQSAAARSIYRLQPKFLTPSSASEFGGNFTEAPLTLVYFRCIHLTLQQLWLVEHLNQDWLLRTRERSVTLLGLFNFHWICRLVYLLARAL